MAKREHIAVGPDPWDARSLEWMVQSPTPAHNFDEVPIVTHLDEFWHRKYGEDERGRPVRIAATEDVVQPGDPTGVHLPSPSYWPIVLAAGLPLIGYGVIFNLGFAFVGALHRPRGGVRAGARAVRRSRRRSRPRRPARRRTAMATATGAQAELPPGEESAEDGAATADAERRKTVPS